jgi:lipopolysaccharide/colanic/teichoic acid biosynthesis glycosyltransferase
MQSKLMTLSRFFFRSPQSVQRYAKRVFDVTASAATLIVLSPLFLFISLAIKIASGGPVFDRRIEYCYSNQVIQTLRFCCNTERVLGHILLQSGIVHLPTLINVIRGEMSIVGPRSYIVPPLEISGKQLPRDLRNSNFRPGLIGPAKSHLNDDPGRPADIQQQIDEDLSYVEGWSLFLDLKIVAMAFISKRSYRLH